MFSVLFAVDRRCWAWCTVSADGVGFEKVAFTTPGGGEKIETQGVGADGEPWVLDEKWVNYMDPRPLFQFQRVS